MSMVLGIFSMIAWFVSLVLDTMFLEGTIKWVIFSALISILFGLMSVGKK